MVCGAGEGDHWQGQGECCPCIACCAHQPSCGLCALAQRMAQPNDYVVCILSLRGALAVKVVQVRGGGFGGGWGIWGPQRGVGWTVP